MASVSGFFKTIAPFLSVAASFVPGVPALGIAAQALSKVTGASVDPKGDAIAKAMTDLTMSEDGRLKLAAAEQDFQKTMAQLGYDHVEKMQDLQFTDVQSARNREIQVRDKTPMLLAWLVVVCVIVTEGFVLFKGVPMTVDGVVLGRVLGTLDSALIMVLSYYFGSSAGSDAKTAILATQAAKEPTK